MPVADGADIGAALRLLEPLRAWGERCYSRLDAIRQWAESEAE